MKILLSEILEVFRLESDQERLVVKRGGVFGCLEIKFISYIKGIIYDYIIISPEVRKDLLHVGCPSGTSMTQIVKLKYNAVVNPRVARKSAIKDYTDVRRQRVKKKAEHSIQCKTL